MKESSYNTGSCLGEPGFLPRVRREARKGETLFHAPKETGRLYFFVLRHRPFWLLEPGRRRRAGMHDEAALLCALVSGANKHGNCARPRGAPPLLEDPRIILFPREVTRRDVAGVMPNIISASVGQDRQNCSTEVSPSATLWRPHTASILAFGIVSSQNTWT